jgi:hypothetical protein
VKIRDTIRRHADGLGFTIEQLQRQFGWDAAQMTHDARHAYDNGCPYCNAAFKSMGHGLTDITLDIVRRDQPPYYAINVKWVCATCNRTKGRRSAEEWAVLLASWATWKRVPRQPSQPALF